MARNHERSRPRSLLPLIASLAVCLFMWPALLTFDVGDWPSPNQYPHNAPSVNACGLLGAWCAYQLFYYLGDGVYPILLFATLAAGMRVVRGEIGHVGERLLGLALLVACTSASAHLLAGAGANSLPVGHGGVIGFALGELLARHVSGWGTLVVLGSSLFVGLLFATEGWVLKIPGVTDGLDNDYAAQVAGALEALEKHDLVVMHVEAPDEESDIRSIVYFTSSAG